ncbi:MAG: SDR family oxidoreductase [Bacteroidetes bacterium]|nr:SDR family oxidoreductase [Bacteroidota bacterium]
MANNKCVLITGGTSGIGLELAKLFAKDGYKLIIVARDMNELNATQQQLQSEFGCEVTTVSKDLFNPDNAFALYDEVKAKGMQVDVLINDAGQGQYGEFKDTDIRRELDIINLNICSLVVLTKLYLKEMVSRGDGKILNLSSIASKTPGPWQSVYHGTKAFVQSFTEGVRSEVKDKGVTLTALLPGATDTDFFNKAEMQESKIVAEGKLGDAAEVAKKGYDALMNGDDMVITGFKNKMMVGMSNIMTDEAAAQQMKKQQEPVNKK